jgi:hypothetical protein
VSVAFLLLPVVVIGALICGTSSLYLKLIRHREIGAAITKEVHFFDNNHDRGMAWYRAHFPTVFERLKKRRSGARFLACEASPYYLFHPHAPARLKALIPRAKLIVLLRNPVERAYSHYHHSLRKGYEPLSFEQAVDKEPERLSGEMDRMLADPRYLSAPHQQWSYVSRGVYIDQLERWSELFPREQLLILHLAELSQHPALTWSRVTSFLELDGCDFAESKPRSEGRYAQLDKATRGKLQEWFRPHNARLYDWLQQDLGWDR